MLNALNIFILSSTPRPQTGLQTRYIAGEINLRLSEILDRLFTQRSSYTYSSTITTRCPVAAHIYLFNLKNQLRLRNFNWSRPCRSELWRSTPFRHPAKILQISI